MLRKIWSTAPLLVLFGAITTLSAIEAYHWRSVATSARENTTAALKAADKWKEKHALATQAATKWERRYHLASGQADELIEIAKKHQSTVAACLAQIVQWQTVASRCVGGSKDFVARSAPGGAQIRQLGIRSAFGSSGVGNSAEIGRPTTSSF